MKPIVQSGRAAGRPLACPGALCLFTVLFLITGCHLGPRYEAPDSAAPPQWKTQAESVQVPEEENWWDIFHDEELAKLERQVIEKNPDLYVALQRVAEARAVAGAAKSHLYPEVGLNPNYNNVDELIQLYGVPQGLYPGLKTITRVHEMAYQLPVSMSYEVDLWGKYRGTYHAAAIYAEAQTEALRSVILALTADLASNYFNIRAMDTQIELLSAIVALQRQTQEIINARYQAGLAGYMDVMRAEEELSNADAEYQSNVRQRALFENAIAALIGLPASDVRIETRPLSEDPPAIPPGIPADVLLRRPDLAQAERTMASFHEFIGVAYSTYLPSISLTSSLGYSSPDLSQFLRWTSRLWQIGVNMAQVLFNGGKNAAYVELAYAKFRTMKGAYEKAVLSAFQEVEDALNGVEMQNKQFEALARTYMAAQERALLSRLRYEKGVASGLDPLDVERSELNAKRIWMNVLGQRYQSAIQLIKALGGGWESLSGCTE